MAGTVVIVDDNDAFRAGTRALLDSEGYEVIGEARDGASGARLVGSLQPDLALLDVQLPDTDGFAVAQSLRDASCPTRVVIISTREASDYGGAVSGCGALGFIAKSELCGDALRSLLRSSP